MPPDCLRSEPAPDNVRTPIHSSYLSYNLRYLCSSRLALRAFAALARRGSFSAAAEELVISQPAVSKHIAELEAELGTRLVIRGSRRIRLTPAGEFVAHHVERAAARVAQAARGARSLAGAQAGRLDR